MNKRLTEKNTSLNWGVVSYHAADHILETELAHKLGQLEDIEEEYNKLGIDMLSFLKTNLNFFNATNIPSSLTEEDRENLIIK